MSCPIVSSHYNQSPRYRQNCLHQDHTSDAVDFLLWRQSGNNSWKGEKTFYSALQSFWQFPFALCNPSQSYTLTCKYAYMQSWVSFGYKLPISLQIIIFHSLPQCLVYIHWVNLVLLIWRMGEMKGIMFLEINNIIVLVNYIMRTEDTLIRENVVLCLLF